MRILSGVQPSGKLHIGNYLGAVKEWIDLQEKGECFFFIADLHSITAPQKPDILRENIIAAAVDYLALGLDPKKCGIFIQSRVKEHTELAWILGTITPLGDLERMTQFKEKSERRKKLVGAGLINYPILMAADILLYKTEIVPVGQDQLQHIELARSLAKRFNGIYGETFPLPKPMLPKFGARIMSLKDPKKKMSKSEPEGCLFIFDSPDEIREKIKTAVTDSGKEAV
ncbi:MAG: tryptophan--tRNA ligase, partial [Patescibacteria group bacterium]